MLTKKSSHQLGYNKIVNRDLEVLLFDHFAQVPYLLPFKFLD